MKIKSFLIILSLFQIFFFLFGCSATPFLKKEDIKTISSKVRDDVLEIQKKDPVVDQGLSKNSDLKTKIAPKIISEIKGKEKSLKFKDKSWKNFPISINFVDIPIRYFFKSIQKMTGINFVVGNEVQGKVSLYLNDVYWTEVVDIVKNNNNLISEVNDSGNLVVIHSTEFVTKQSNLLQKAMVAKVSASKAISNIEPKVTSIIKLDYAKPDILSKQLTDIILTLEGASGQTNSKNARASFVVDSRTNSIIIQSSPNDLNWIKSAILNLDKPTKQVLVEVFIIEGSDDFQYEFGSRVGIFTNPNSLSATGTLGGTPPTTGGEISLSETIGSVSNNPIIGTTALGGIALSFGNNNNDLRLQLEAMQRESLIKIVSNPKLFIIDNEEASILDGTEVPYTATAMLGASPSVQFKNAALQLKVRPSVIGDGNVYLDLSVNKDTPLTGTPPPISKKELKTKLLVRDGGVALIGGINKSETTTIEGGVPFFAKLPFFGKFFKSTGDKKSLNQLYIFLAPRVL